MHSCGFGDFSCFLDALSENVSMNSFYSFSSFRNRLRVSWTCFCIYRINYVFFGFCNLSNVSMFQGSFSVILETLRVPYKFFHAVLETFPCLLDFRIFPDLFCGAIMKISITASIAF